MTNLTLNNGLLREFKADELSNNLTQTKNITIPVDSTPAHLTLASISMNIEDSKNPVSLNGSVGWTIPLGAATIVVTEFRIYRSINNSTPTEIFSTLDSAFDTMNPFITTSITHVDLPSVTPCNANVTYTLTAHINSSLSVLGTTPPFAKIIGPITFYGSEIQFKQNYTQITNTPNTL